METHGAVVASCFALRRRCRERGVLRVRQLQHGTQAKAERDDKAGAAQDGACALSTALSVSSIRQPGQQADTGLNPAMSHALES